MHDGPDHHLSLDANTVWTDEYRLVRRLIEDIESANALGVAHGDAGLGKTFSVRSGLLEKARAPYVLLEFPARTTQRYVARRILKELTGISETGTIFDLTEHLLDELSSRSVLLVVDEAQRLTGPIIEYLRMLHDNDDTRFGLLLVGGNRCWEILSREPMLCSRIYRRVEFTPWGLERTLKIIPRFHAIYHHVSPELFAFVDDKFAHGSFRNWAQFTLTARNICRAHQIDQLTEDVARNAFTLLCGGPMASRRNAA